MDVCMCSLRGGLVYRMQIVEVGYLCCSIVVINGNYSWFYFYIHIGGVAAALRAHFVGKIIETYMALLWYVVEDTILSLFLYATMMRLSNNFHGVALDVGRVVGCYVQRQYRILVPRRRRSS